MEGIPAKKREEAAQLLVSMLSTAPALAPELAELLDVLDEGENVYVDGVKDASLRSQLAAFLTTLGLGAPDGERGVEGFDTGKAFRCGKGGGGVLRGVATLLDESGMVGPPPIDREAAFDSAKQVVDSLAAEEGMEGVRQEVPALLEQILGGELVVLEGLGDAKIRDALSRLFGALGLEARRTGDDGETGWGVPDRGFDDTEAVMKRVIAAYVDSGSSGSSDGDGREKKGGEGKGAVDAARGTRKSPIGPAMPSAAVLAQAQRAAASYSERQDLSSSLSSSSEDDEDAVGPSVADKEKRVATERVDPDSAKRQKRHELKRAAEWERATGVMTGGQAALDKAEADEGTREEWMLVPPKSLGVLGAVKTLQPTNRKFQTRSARGARAELDARAAVPKSKAELEAEAAAEELMAKHREARGPSLVERYKQDKASDTNKKARGQGAERGGGKQRNFSWSREEDLESRRHLTPQMYEELVQKSHQLDSKFSRSVSRNFL